MRALAVLAVVAVLAACPKPPPPPHDAGPPPDSGVPGAVGAFCLSAKKANECKVGLECNAPLDAGPDDGGNLLPDGGGVGAEFACVTPGDIDAGCFFTRDTDPVKPVDDGCKEGLVCGSANSCANSGVLGAPCKSPTDCTTTNCGRLADNSASVCVVNDCLNPGCPTNDVCQQQGQCGLVCVASPAAGEACFTAGTDACSPVTTPCSNGLQCYDGDPNSVVKCAVPSDTNGPCNTNTTQQGCKNSTDHCDPASETCVPN
jgi:hypothetical protein